MRSSASGAPYAFSVLADFLLERRNDVIEWEGGHSMADLSDFGLIKPGSAGRVRPIGPSVHRGWDPTMPAALGDTPEPLFQETIKGLSTREVHEPDLFKHFFEYSIVR
jgi:hypothetical protein